MFSFSSLFVHRPNRIHGTNARRNANDASDDAAANADDVLSGEPDALDDATSLQVIESHPTDETADSSLQSTRNYKPNELSLLNVSRRSRGGKPFEMISRVNCFIDAVSCPPIFSSNFFLVLRSTKAMRLD